ncbi:MAG: sulfatase [Verrucomicrobia bacterium]|nr:sulfatase [Verrucomicrobiota bacterium]
MKSLVLLLAVALGASGDAASLDAPGGSRPPNILFLAIDDLRTGLGAPDAAPSATPALDALAASGRLFTHHYTQVPTCGASRCSLLRGRYPDTAAQLGNDAIKATQTAWAERSMPGWFRRHGYQTLALGKITHYPGGLTGKDWAEGPEELSGVWDRCWIPKTPWGTPRQLMHGYANGKGRDPGQSPAWEAFAGPDAAYPDAWIADEAIATLKQLRHADSPWFFAVGFFKPHLPFAAPEHWFDATDANTLPRSVVTNKPAGVSSWHRSAEFRQGYGHDGKDPAVDADYERQLRHAYASAAHYMDAQVGRLLGALEELGLAGNTIVVAWGDHGFLLGEHAIWGKHCLYEKALQSPLIIRAPAVKQPGIPADGIVETVDILPTLTELCGLPTPEGLSGRSLLPQLTDPAVTRGKPAIGFWGGQRTVRTERWRLIAHESKEGGLRGVELFDLRSDPDEADNVAAENPKVVESLMAALEEVPRPSAAKP